MISLCYAFAKIMAYPYTSWIVQESLIPSFIHSLNIY